MAKKKEITRVIGRLTQADRERHAKLRAAAMKEFPPKSTGLRPAEAGLGAAIRAARESQGLTWYAVAQQAGLPNQGTVRDMELGRDVKVSNLRAVAQVLGLKVELVPAEASS
jgi:hypothetical protein